MAKKGAGEGAKSSKAGRRTKTSEVAIGRVDRLFTDRKIKKRQRKELLSILSAMFCRGCTRAEIGARIGKEFPDSYAKLLRGENFWDLLRRAAAENMFTHTPCDELELIQRLQEDYPWLREHVVVSQTAAVEALAQRAAVRLLDLIRTVRRQQRCDTVHVGFAGGMTLRAVAEKLARLLDRHHQDDPKMIVFHAMVAGFDDDDFYADPNSFITYFITRNRRLNVRLVRLPLPGIVGRERYPELRRVPEISRAFDRRSEIQIIVTSGSLWGDEHSTLRAYLKAAEDESRRQKESRRKGDSAPKKDSAPAGESHPDNVIREFEKHGVIGDLLWQPINGEGAVDVETEYRMTTLMELKELPGFIDNGGSVLLVMGCSGISRMPKSNLLKTILDLHRKQKWVTDVVTDSPTVEGIYVPEIRDSMWDPSEKPKQPPRPR